MTSTTISESLDALQIKRIIIVDDDVDRALEDEPARQLKVHVRELHDDLRSLGVKYPDVDLLDAAGDLRPDGELREALDSLWGELEKSEQERLLSRVPDLVSDHLGTMFAQVAEHVTVIPKAVKSWDGEDFNALFGGENPTTLVLFDLNLENAGRGTEGGMELLNELRDKQFSNVFLGILTQDATSMETESDLSATFTEKSDHAVPVLGKFRLNDANEFALGLAAFVLAEDLHRIRRHTADVIQKAAEDAITRADKLGFYILLAAARSANTEGLYEGSGLVRMLFTLVRRHTEQALTKAAPMEEVARLRKVIGRNPGFSPPTDAQRELIDDVYESAEHLLTTQAPTEVGDLYEFTDEDNKASKYILLAQSCDLMVRSDGLRRNGDGHFVLAKVVEHDPSEKTESTDGTKLIPLGRLPREDGSWAVNLAARAFVPPDLLDACVFGVDGRSHLPLETKSKVPNLAWEKRRGKVNSWWLQRRRCALKLATDIQALGADGKLRPAQRKSLQLFALRAELGRHFADTGIVSVAPTKTDLGSVEIGIRRIGRLTEPHAKAMLLQFSHYHSRPALPASLLAEAE